MRQRHVKCFCCVILLFLSVLIWYCILSIRLLHLRDVTKFHTKSEDMIYILKWTKPEASPFDAFKEGTKTFHTNNCAHRNCFVTGNRNYFKRLTDFTALIFNGKNLGSLKKYQLPQERSFEQIYIFTATESSHYYPLCSEYFDDMFNWTYTYKIDSDIKWGYITIYDLNGKIIGPKTDMKWPETLKPIDDELKNKLKSKRRAAAWFVSNCHSLSRRESYVTDLNKYLSDYQLQVDIYGPCGNFKCSRKNSEECFKKIEDNYYFYLSFENSFAEDYVTEKLLNALNHCAVPIVYGSADYSRFLPPGSYLNARQTPPQDLAATIHQLIHNQTAYYSYFQWRNHFKYKETTETEDLCKLCDALNDITRTGTRRAVKDLRRWFNGDNIVNC